MRAERDFGNRKKREEKKIWGRGDVDRREVGGEGRLSKCEAGRGDGREGGQTYGRGDRWK